MTAHYIENWRQYLTEDDYTFLVQYIENVKNDISNDKMIILSGPGRTGKSTLMNDIQTYLGNDLYGYFEVSGEIIYSVNIKRLGFFPEIGSHSPGKKDSRAIINLIKYKQSLITATNFIESINNNLLQFCRVIKMEHVFPSDEYIK